MLLSFADCSREAAFDKISPAGMNIATINALCVCRQR